MSPETEAWRVIALRANAYLKSDDTSSPLTLIRDLLKIGNALILRADTLQNEVDALSKKLDECERTNAAAEPKGDRGRPPSKGVS